MKGPHSPATISERPGFGSATSRTNKSALVLWNTPRGNQSSVTGKYYVILRWNHCEWGVWATKPLSLPLGGNTGALLLSLPPTSDWWFHSLNKIFSLHIPTLPSPSGNSANWIDFSACFICYNSNDKFQNTARFTFTFKQLHTQIPVARLYCILSI